MGESNQGHLTETLRKAGAGDAVAAADLLPLLYDELRGLARQKMRHEAPGHTLQPTALVHEAYLRLLGGGAEHALDHPMWANRAHFFAAAAEAMRRILIERARRRQTIKHGGGRARLDVEDLTIADPAPDTDMLELDAALSELEKEDPVRSEVVKLRYFAGLTIEQTANALGLSATTVSRHWAFSQAWLYQRILKNRNES